MRTSEDLIFVKTAELEHKSNHAPRVLIVDDDVDSAVLVQQVFAKLGCETACSLNGRDARKTICAGKSDLIILDWCLDQIEAGAILDECRRTFEKFGEHGAKPRVVTYSSLKPNEIEFVETPFFEYLGHWQKPMTAHDILTRVLALLGSVQH